MTKLFAAALLLFSLFISSYTQEPERPTPARYAIVNASVLDLNTGEWLKKNLIINGQKIEQVGSKIDSEIEQIDASGKYIIPGLTDAHMHYFQSGGLYTRPDVADLRAHKSYEEEKKWISENLDDIQKRYLACGITSVFDVGGPFSNFEIKDKASKNPLAPTAFVTGPLISTYQPTALGDEDPPIIKVSSVEEAQEMVWKQAKFKPDFIKVWYIVSKEEPAEKNYPIVKAIGDLCKELNIKFAVHATQLETAKLAIKAGANLLVHSVDDKDIDKEFIKLMKKNNVNYIPTLQVYENYARTFSQDFDLTEHEYRWANPEMLNSLFYLKTLKKPELNPRLKLLTNQVYKKSKRDTVMANNLAALHKAKINIIAGTDAGNIGTHHGASLLRELLMMHSAGMGNLDVIRSATVNSIQIHQQKEYGEIAANKWANLVVLNEDPIKDLMAIAKIAFVINKGQKIEPEKEFPRSAFALAQEQLIGYNNGDIDAFLRPYSQNIEAYNLNGDILFKGKDKMRERYASFFLKNPKLHCQLTNRLMLGNNVIDEELVTGIDGIETLRAIAIYTIKNEEIVRVDFVRE